MTVIAAFQEAGGTLAADLVTAFMTSAKSALFSTILVQAPVTPPAVSNPCLQPAFMGIAVSRSFEYDELGGSAVA